jgi:hypothetical protein
MDRHRAARESLTAGVESQVSDANDREHGLHCDEVLGPLFIVDVTPLCAAESLRERSSRKFWFAFDRTSCGPNRVVLPFAPDPARATFRSEEEQMTSRSMLISAAAIMLTGCVASPTGQVRASGTGCPMNFKPYCEVSRHRAEAPDMRQCRCVRHRDISGMFGADSDY